MASLADQDDVRVVDSHDCYVTLIGPPSALMESHLILPDWLPALPKRVASSHDSEGWWTHPAPDDEMDIYAAEFKLQPHPVASWELRRKKGGEFEFCIRARYTRYFIGGPYDPDAGKRAMDWHRQMVRARSDAAFRRLLDKVVPTAA